MEHWREGTLSSTNELAGERVSVQIDGGRTKIRGDLTEPTPVPVNLNEFGLDASDAPGRSKSRPQRSVSADWREPKLLTIFVHDEKGRMQKKSQATIDGTFRGTDATAELVAMHLHRLGAAKAKSITFVSDGAVWIWDRLDSIVQQVGIPDSVSIHQVLDNCHAVHHVSLALATMSLDQDIRMPLYRDMRTRLRNGRWRSVVADLQELANDDSMLQLRALVISNRWDDRLTQMRSHKRRTHRPDWNWTPQSMTRKSEDPSKSSQTPA